MKLVVVGLGEMGASLALAMKRGRGKIEIVGVDNDERTMNQAVQLGIIDKMTTDLQSAVIDADLIVLATPTEVIIDYLTHLARLTLKQTVVVTDTGSTKVQVMQAARELTTAGINFVGGHAMAGTQKAGVTAADEKLYDEVPYFLISTQPKLIETTQRLLAPLQAKFTTITAVKHDQMMAQLSDLPHIVAAALVNSTAQTLQAEPELPQYAAGGFKDTTRIGGADPKMWTDVLMTNRPATLAALQHYQAQIAAMISVLENGDAAGINAFFTSSRAIRAKFEE